jgi:hypothetical protein
MDVSSKTVLLINVGAACAYQPVIRSFWLVLAILLSNET